ncbi:3787_t:CDS:10 [Paraglomus occultum]|uniref:3787_t:CDS:1 n=1 Tax=Paraglomus occultum TaxID=144539 RepID=A0A9N9G333_9GLOM|nr:3787_t:CDS:10 [Paraglomus occultum]
MSSTTAKVPTLLNTTFLTSGLSRGLFEFVTKVADARSKQEEDLYVSEELLSLTKKLSKPEISSVGVQTIICLLFIGLGLIWNLLIEFPLSVLSSSPPTFVDQKKMKDYIIRLIYCDMLGHNVEFGYIHAVKLAQSGKNIWEKRAGYLACSLFLYETHELSIMLINTVQKDLKSSNELEVNAAISALCSLLYPEMIPAVIQLIEGALKHSNDSVRRKAVMVCQRLYRIAPDTISHLEDTFREILANKDYGTLSAILCLFSDLVQDKPEKYKDIVPTLISKLEQVIDRWLPRAYDYHGASAPWIQIKLVRILGLLAKDDEEISQEIEPLIIRVLRKAEDGVDAAYAIIFECIRSLSLLHPRVLPSLVNKSGTQNPLSIIARFLKSHNHNLKYLGLTALQQVDPVWWTEGGWWGEEQMNVIVDCLEDKDETLKKKTLDILYKMVNLQNATVIVDRMIDAIGSALTPDNFLRKELVIRVVDICGKYPLNPFVRLLNWLVATLIKLHDVAGDLICYDLSDKSFRIIIKGSEDMSSNETLQMTAVKESIKILERDKQHLNRNLIIFVVRVLGACIEYHEDSKNVIDRLYSVLENTRDAEVQAYTINSLLKCVATTKECPEKVLDAVRKCYRSTSVYVRQQSKEFLELYNSAILFNKVVLGKSNIKNDQLFIFDEKLSFLDSYVQDALNNGAKPYSPVPVTRTHVSEADKKQLEIRYEAYEKPSIPVYRKPNLSVRTDSATNVPISSWTPNITPGQLARMSFSQESVLGREHDEFDGSQHRQSIASSVSSPISKTFATVVEQKWSRAGYRPVIAKLGPSSPPLSTSSNEESHLASATVQATVKPIKTSMTSKDPSVEKTQLVSALFSGLGSGSRTRLSQESSNLSRQNLIDFDTASIRPMIAIMPHLSPVQMTTREFGLLWVNLLHESCIVTNKSHTLESLRRQLEEEGRFGIVESKGSEIIAGAHVVHPSLKKDAGAANLVLLHFKIKDDGRVQFTVKSNVNGIPETIGRELDK